MDTALRIIGYVVAFIFAVVAAIVYGILWTIYHFCYAVYLAWTTRDEPFEPRFLG